LVLELWNAPLHVPWVYTGDGNQYGMFVKGILDHGWHYTNPSLGAPASQQLYDFPIVSGENLQALIVKLLGLPVSDWAAVMNLYFLLTFPLAALTSFAVLRRLGSAAAPAVVCSTLFALAPYHFARGERELFISGYFAVPLGAYLVLAILADEPLFARRASGGSRPLAYASRRSLVAVGLGLSVVLASGSYYYAVFTMLLVGGATILTLLVRRSRRAFASGAIVVALIATGILASLTPTIAYRFEHGPNELVRTRGINESEIFALKLTQLVLPVEEHRIGALAERSTRYADTTPFGHLGRPVHLGLVASAGFVWLLLVALAGAATAGQGWRASARYRPASAATLLAFLIGTVGGISALIAATVTPQFRAWNRISIFIAFFALLAVALALTDLGRRWHDGKRRLAFAGVLTATLVVGVLDQTSPANVPPYDEIRREYASDARFVEAIEARLPAGADVLQLPYVPFPEAGLSGPMGDYDLVRPYFHSQDLRWSFGAEKGRPEDWLAPLAEEPVEVVLAAARSAGFEGLYIDRLGYADRGGAVEADVTRALDGARPLVSANRRLVFFDLRG
ncbi:MAG: hypothetical protein ACRDQT_09625, partial [Gaiellaceae bacterium]